MFRTARRSTILAAALVVGAVAWLSPGEALAGTYRVETCASAVDQRPLAGPTIAVEPLPSGWQLFASDGVPWDYDDFCSLSGAFTFQTLSGTMKAGDVLVARWSPAPATALTGVTMRWTAELINSPQRGEGTAQLTLGTDRQVFFAATSPWSAFWPTPPAPNLAGPVADAKWFDFRFVCLDACSVTYGDNWLKGFVNYAAFDVRDDTAPSGGLNGTALDAQVWSGVMRFGLSASDAGGGLYRAVVRIDGRDALASPIGSASAACADLEPSTATVREFPAAQPCPLRIDNGSLDIDTSKLPQGRHEVSVQLEDAAGNRTTIFGPLTRTIGVGAGVGPGSDPTLRGAANGEGTSDQARMTAYWGRRRNRTTLVTGFGHQHLVRGRLVGPSGAPIADAAIDMVSRTTAVGARTLTKRNGPRTRADGTWYALVPRGASSRNLTFRYRSHVNDTIPSASAVVRLRVQAGVRLAIHPRRARRGQAIRFAGRLLGGPLPPGGKQIVLMARAAQGAWVRFNVVRTGRGGRFHATYRFQQPGAASYRFRAVSLAEAAYPYLAGGSNIVVVRKVN